MKKFLCTFFAVILTSGILCASDYDAFKGSFSMYDATTEMIILKKIESQTDPETEKVMVGGLALTFEFFPNALQEVDGLPVASVYFSDKDDKYVLDYYVDGYKVVKIVLLTKNGEFINKELFHEKEENLPGEKKQSE